LNTLCNLINVINIQRQKQRGQRAVLLHTCVRDTRAVFSPSFKMYSSKCIHQNVFISQHACALQVLPEVLSSRDGVTSASMG
jgi:hypothetical protein